MDRFLYNGPAKPSNRLDRHGKSSTMICPISGNVLRFSPAAADALLDGLERLNHSLSGSAPPLSTFTRRPPVRVTRQGDRVTASG